MFRCLILSGVAMSLAAFLPPDRGPARNTLENVTVTTAKAPAKKLKLAVVKTREVADSFGKIQKWDQMGAFLGKLGPGYRYDDISVDEFILKHEKKKLGDYDVIFLTCNLDDQDDKLKAPIQQFVSNGGILYATDWRYSAVAAAFPDLAVPALMQEGAAQMVEADLVNSALRDVLGKKTISLDFPLAEWKPAAFGGPGVEIMIKGTYSKLKGKEKVSAPLLVRFPFNKGSVVFSSFHYDAKNSVDKEKLLQFLVFSLVTASVDGDLQSRLGKGAKRYGANVQSISPQGEISRLHDNKQVCALRFGLGFRGDGAKLRVSIKSPGGKQFTQDCEGTTILEVADAEPGEWRYTVTALDVHANFAFLTAVGEIK
jgi:hypothetical protein